MPRTKNYLRYVHESTFGVVAASQAGVSIKYLPMRDTKDRFVAVSANETVLFWDLKTRQIINKLTYDVGDTAVASEVSIIECFHGGHPRTNLIAVGYANGHIRVFEYETGMLKTTFTGHRVAITALVFDKDGSRLASGAKDCTIVLWDVVGEKGLFSLRGHKNSISKLAFLYNDEHQKDLLVSSSIDAVATVKFWDLQLQHCFCTLPGHSSGVWSFVLLKNGTRLITGSSGPELKVYSIRFLSDTEKQSASGKVVDGGEYDELDVKSEVEYGLQVKPLGQILRNTIAISNRVQDLTVDPDESILVCHSTDKNVEFYELRSDEEALTYAKKLMKKAARKATKRKRATEGGDGQDESLASEEEPRPVQSIESLEPQMLVDCEFNRKLGFQKLPDKVKSLDVIKFLKKDGSVSYKLAVATASNKIDTFNYEPPKGDQEALLEQQNSIESMSHRNDVRCIAISTDNTLILSASAESAKLWRLDSRACIATIETEYATCCTFANALNLTTSYHQNKFALLGTKQGHLQLIDVAETRVCETIKICDNDKPLNSICVLPDQSGIVCGGEDGIVRFYNYVWKELTDDEDDSGKQKQTILSLEESRTLIFQEGITCLTVSANNNLLAVSLLDSTVRVHFVDTFKYFLTMYGHKFPVTTMDISDDNTLLVTGSPDKNIKIWGLDFGDCHKSIFAHDDVITCVKFIPKTHHIFSCARDRQIKQWDCDIFIKIQTLRKHMAEIWCLGLSTNGKYLVTGSHDKSIRIFRKTEEILVPSEEEETERELEDERNVFEKQDNIVLGETDAEAGFAVKMTIETVKSTDRLIEAIDVFGSEQEKEREYVRLCELADSKKEPRPAEPERDPLLMTVMTTDYHRFMLEILRRIKSSELEEILLTLPFDYVRKLLIILVIFLERGWDVELVVRCATFLLKVNFGQIAASPTLSPIVYKLKTFILNRTKHLRECAGFNLMALEHLSQNKRYQSSKVLRAPY
uniref:WD repeat-containing protein 3 n=1 Tax=Aceria tosichella TaxID=561515 RepID=A0A6G1SP55_9ACAR